MSVEVPQLQKTAKKTEETTLGDRIRNVGYTPIQMYLAWFQNFRRMGCSAMAITAAIATIGLASRYAAETAATSLEVGTVRHVFTDQGFQFYLNRLVLRDPASQAAIPIPIYDKAGVEGSVGIPALSPDGKKVAFMFYGPTMRDYNLYVRSLSDGKMTRIEHNQITRTIQWSPDGNKLLLLSTYRTDGDIPKMNDNGIFVLNPDGSDKQLLVANDRSITAFCWQNQETMVFATEDRNDAWTEENIQLWRFDVSDRTSKPITNLKLTQNLGLWHKYDCTDKTVRITIGYPRMIDSIQVDLQSGKTLK